MCMCEDYANIDYKNTLKRRLNGAYITKDFPIKCH